VARSCWSRPWPSPAPPLLEAASPADLCHEADTVELALSGQDFLVSEAGDPTVRIDGQAVPVTQATDCVAIPSAPGVEACSGLVVSVQPSLLAIGTLDIDAANPEPAACGDSLPRQLTVRPSPSVDAVTPAQVCDQGSTVEVQGSDFVEGMTATVGGVVVDEVDRIDDHTLELVLPEGALPAGTWDLELGTPGGCGVLLPQAVTVSLPPVAFAVEPPVVPVGLSVTLTAWLSDVFDTISAVHLEDEAGLRREAAWTWDPAQPDRVQVQLPDDLPMGAWRVVADQGEGCLGSAAATVQITADLPVAIGQVEAPYAWAYDDTPVEIQAPDPVPSSSPGFADGARAWLVDPDGVNGTARLAGMRSPDPTRLSAVVRYGLPLDTYDLILVNPDGSAGYLPAAVEVVDSAPPRIDSVSPGTVQSTGDPAITIQGRDFRDPTASLRCQTSAGEVRFDLGVDGWTGTSIDATVPSGFVNQAVCVVEVVDADGTSARFSAISITNPAQNLFPWQAGPDLVVPRRAPAAAAGRTTSVRRWLYAVGGDGGEAASALASMEVAPVGLYGEIGAWSLLPRSLPQARTLAAVAVVGNFVYLVGGSKGGADGGADGGTAVDTTWRAGILDPLAVPWQQDVSLSSSDTGLAPGTWIYRVSARYADDDASNPGGESLATDPRLLTLPDLGTRWQVRLRWTEVEGAVGYRVYRSPAADAAPGAEAWVADVSEAAFTDTGLSTDAAVLPLAEGALGEWAVLDTLTTPRRSPCMAQAPDPGLDPQVVYLYLAGGADEHGAVLDSVEVLPITIVSEHEQRAGSWSTTDLVLSKARERCGAMGVDSAWHSLVPQGESWVYFAGGSDGSRAVGNVDVAKVERGGLLSGIDQVDSLTPARSGFAAASASNFLYAFGGQQDGPSDGGSSAELQATDLPNLRSWNSLGTSLSEARWLPGSAQESAVLFVVGGQTDRAGATASTDWTNF